MAPSSSSVSWYCCPSEDNSFIRCGKLKESLSAFSFRVTATASGVTVTLRAKANNTPLSLKVTETAAKGSVAHSKAQDYPLLNGSVRLGSANTASQPLTTWADQAEFSQIGSTTWAAIATFDGGRQALVASSGSGVMQAPGQLRWLELATHNDKPATHWGKDVNGSLGIGRNWVAVAANAGTVSASGTTPSTGVPGGRVLLAAEAEGMVYLARTDADQWDWGAVLGPADWSALSASDDGRVLVAASKGEDGALWLSSDAGLSWREVAGSQGGEWTAVAVLGDGSRVTAAGAQGLVSFTVITARSEFNRVGLEAAVGAARFIGMPGMEVAVTDVTIGLNLAAKGDGQVVDWATTGLDVLTGPESSRALTMDGAAGPQIGLSGSLQLRLGDSIYLDGSASFAKRSSEVTLADGAKVAVDALTVAATDVNAFVGLEGPYRQDTTGDGIIDEQDTLNPDAVGLSLGGVNVGLGLFAAKAGAVNAAGKSLAGARWLARCWTSAEPRPTPSAPPMAARWSSGWTASSARCCGCRLTRRPKWARCCNSRAR